MASNQGSLELAILATGDQRQHGGRTKARKSQGILSGGQTAAQNPTNPKPYKP